MTPGELATELMKVTEAQIPLSLMIWGPPGIGKSSIVAQVAHARDIGLVDLRLSQLAPTDLRGLPVADEGVSRWYPPSFLPTEGEGILFLDEINMAPPAMQGVAQQLILDRRVGDYVAPDGWFVWAAGNRKVDRAAVYDMPSALSNRFLHFEVEPDLDAFRRWALTRDIDERVLAFLLFRPALLHQYTAGKMAWPSPRSWEMASVLATASLSIEPAVGEAAAGEYEAYCAVYERLPDLDAILEGERSVEFPEEPSAQYAVVLGLAMRATEPGQACEGLRWLNQNAGKEWLQLYVSDLFTLYRERGEFPQLLKALNGDEELKALAAEIRDLLLR